MKTVADRIFLVRKKILNLSRAAFEKYGIPQTTLRNWETSIIENIPEHHVQKLVLAFKEHGISCDEKWIMTGNGESPFDNNFSAIHTKYSTYDDFEYLIKKYSGSKLFSINNDKLMPFLNFGDAILGVEHEISHEENLYVVETDDAQTIIGFCSKVSQQMVAVRYTNISSIDFIRRKDILRTYSVFHVRRFTKL